MRRIRIAVVSALIVISLTTSAVFAGRGHFTGSVIFTLGSLNASGTLAGLGNRDVLVTLEGSGIGTATCTNKGGSQAPGQNPIQVDVSGVQTIVASLTDNGSAPFFVATDAPPMPSARAAGCPNNNWKVTSLFVSWTSAVITVSDALTGEIVLRQDFACTTTGTSVSCTPTP